ncbi:MAG: hypothetical protein R3277_02145 [Brumimicrobium sp.]|nr:hypothetical protein [Brumimicrobium sp.]
MKYGKFFIAVITLLLWSCQDKEKEKYLQEVEGMEQRLDSLKTVALEKRVDTIPQVVLSVRNTISKVKDNYYADTIDMQIAQMMNQYKDIRKILSSNTGNYAKVNTTIPEVEQKLKDLEHDIEKGVGDREKYQEYINFEKKKIEEIESVLNYYIETNEKYLNKYDSLHPIVLNFIEDLKMKNEK